jgi:hypothetical protein
MFCLRWLLENNDAIAYVRSAETGDETALIVNNFSGQKEGV